VTTRGAILAALLAVLGRPAWWLLGLAGFLARGGILLFVLAIVTLPSPLAISNVVAPLLTPIVFGGVTATLAAVIAAGIGSVVAFVLLGALIGAATEVVLVHDARDAAGEEGVPLGPVSRSGRWLIGRVAVAHLLAHIPVVIVAALGSIQIVGVAYVELTSPADVATPLPVRIVGGAIVPILAIVVAWVIGEIAGGLAARSIAVRGSSVLRSVSRAYGDLVSRPRSALLPGLLTTAILALDLAAMLAAVALAWTIARSRLVEIPAAPVGIGLALASFAAMWCLALLVTGLIAAWRSVAMTFEEERRAAAEALRHPRPDGPDGRSVAGTFGAPSSSRPGDWSAHNGGGSL
jgi:hypothetical protein